MNPVSRRNSEALWLVSETIPVSFTEMLHPVTQYLKYGTGAADNDDSQFGTSRTVNLEGNVQDSGIFSLDTEDDATRPLVPNQGYFASATSLSERTSGFSSQTLSDGSGLSGTGDFVQTPSNYELKHHTGMGETYHFLQTNGATTPGFDHNAAVGDAPIFNLSIPSVCGGNGGNSHFSEITGPIAHIGTALHGWKAPYDTDLWGDAHLPRKIHDFNIFGQTSRFGGSMASAQDHFHGSNTSADTMEQQSSQALSIQDVDKRYRRPARRTVCAPVPMGGFHGSLRSSGPKKLRILRGGPARESLTGKRKRTDGGPEDVLEGIFIVTRQPNNGQTRSIADLIGWTFQDVHEWFEKRALWEVSHALPTKSPSVDMLSNVNTNANNKLFTLYNGDSGFCDLPVDLVDTRKPKKRLKRPPSGTGIVEAGGDEGRKEVKVYVCIHEDCVYSSDKFGEWKRHMASVHFPGRWACLLKEEDQVLPADNSCLSCRISFRSIRDLKEHIHLSRSCPDTSAIVRVFDRKDKLTPHWERWHRYEEKSRHPGDADLCEREIKDFDEKCGFCELSFASWDSKIEHVGIHFKDEGRKIATWKYPDSNDDPSTLRRSFTDEHNLPDDPPYDYGDESSDTDDSDSDDDGDRPMKRRYHRKDDRDRDKGGASGSRGTSGPSTDSRGHKNGSAPSGESKDNGKNGRGSYVRYRSGSANEWATEVAISASFVLDPCWNPEFHHLRSPGAMPAHQNIRKLGHGGFGAVNEIRIKETNQLVARKRILRFPHQNREAARELCMIKKLQSLDHCHIVRFLGSYATDTYIDILMLPVADYDLNEFMLRHQPPIPSAVKSQMVRFCSCLASAVDYIHQRDIRHRDIKPKNILVANGIVLIADFGSASDTYIEVGKESVGITPKYAAPEVFKGGRHEPAADVWSLGCVMMELMTTIHDKTLLELEIFRSSKTRLGAASPFHTTIGEIHTWLRVLPTVGSTPSLMWNGVSYLDTIVDMLQEDERNRPTAGELLRRFSPSYCCSKNLGGSIAIDQTRMIEPTEMDYIFNVSPNIRKLSLCDPLPDSTRRRIMIQNEGHIKPETISGCFECYNPLVDEIEENIKCLSWYRQNLPYAASYSYVLKPKKDWKALEDAIKCDSNFPFDGEELRVTRRRHRRRYTREELVRIAQIRKRGACGNCRAAKTRCSHGSIPAAADQQRGDSQSYQASMVPNDPHSKSHENWLRRALKDANPLEIITQALCSWRKLQDKGQQFCNFPAQNLCFKLKTFRGDIRVENLLPFKSLLSGGYEMGFSDSLIGVLRHLHRKTHDHLLQNVTSMPESSRVINSRGKGELSDAQRALLFVEEITRGIHHRKTLGTYNENLWFSDHIPDSYEELKNEVMFGIWQGDHDELMKKSPLRHARKESAYLASSPSDVNGFDTLRQINSLLSARMQELQRSQMMESPPPPLALQKPRRSIPCEVVIAVMGITGTGKSTFIHRATGSDQVGVGNGLQQVAQDVQLSQFEHAGTKYCLVDTPGFNDTDRSDKHVLREVEDWLLSSFRDGIKLSGVLYLHQISDFKVGGAAQRNLRMFRRLCNEDSMKNVVLGTTFKDAVSKEQGASVWLMEETSGMEKTNVLIPGRPPEFLAFFKSYHREKDRHRILSLAEEFRRAKSRHKVEALLGSVPDVPDENMSFLFTIDNLDLKETPAPNQKQEPDLFRYLMIFENINRDFCNASDTQPQYIFHWLGSLNGKSVDMHEVSRTGDGRGQPDHFIRDFTSAPERWKVIEGFPTNESDFPFLVGVILLDVLDTGGN